MTGTRTSKRRNFRLFLPFLLLRDKGVLNNNYPTNPRIARNNLKGVPGMVWNDRCYQVGADTPPRVKDGMPVHVRLRNQNVELDAKQYRDSME